MALTCLFTIINDKPFVHVSDVFTLIARTNYVCSCKLFTLSRTVYMYHWATIHCVCVLWNGTYRQIL